MGGSTLAQFLWNSYAQTLAQTSADVAGNILQAIVPWVQGAMMIYVVIAGKRMLANATSFDRESTAVIRAVVVLFLLTPANFNTYITTAATQTIPNAIAGAVNGQGSLNGAQGFDALFNQIDKFAATIDAQAVGIWYIAERISVWLAQGAASFFVVVCLFVWILAQAAIAFVVPIGAFVIPFYLFDRTREFTMRWVGKLVSLFLILAVSLMLASFVVKMDAQYMQQYATQMAASNAANPGFSMNGGDMNFTGFDNVGAFDVPGNTNAVQQAGMTAQHSGDIAAAINALWHVALVCAFGAFILGIMVGIALYIGGSSGFSAAPAMAAMYMGMRGAAKAAARK